MKNQTVLYHASFWRGDHFLTDGMIVTEDGRIENIYDSFQPQVLEAAGDARDMSGLTLSPGWIDSHLHLPGDFLFRLYGINFLRCASVEAYRKQLEDCQVAGRWIRGFGWNASVMEDGGYEVLQGFLREHFPSRPVLLFSDDYHSCMGNPCAFAEIAAAGVFVSPDEYGIIREKDIFVLTNEFREMSFSEEEMEQAILACQDFLLRLGITAVQTLMFLGGNGDREWQVLKRMDEKGLLKLKVNLALTVQPYEDLGRLEQRLAGMRRYESERIRFFTVKLYMDGVIESRTAYLHEPYEGMTWAGECSWEEDVLKHLCTRVDALGYQIHIHAIGDAAVHRAVEALAEAMDDNDSRGKNRHVITHIQLAADEDIRWMGQYGIIAAMQPYWFPQREDAYGLERIYVGERALQEYKMRTMLDAGVVLTGSSDSPVTDVPDPLAGISMAAGRCQERERVPANVMWEAFTKNGAFQMFRERELGQLEAGFRADVIGFRSGPARQEPQPAGQDPKPAVQEPGEMAKAVLAFVMADGEVLADINR